MRIEHPTARRVAVARTFLFAPGHRPERFEKAVRSGADVLILDLEDSVPGAEKMAARVAIEREWEKLQSAGAPVAVRMNVPNSEAGEADLVLLERLNSIAAVMIPKAESDELLARVHHRLGGVALLPIIESAAGYSALPSLAAARGVLRLVIGHIDFMADSGIDCDSGQNEIAPLRFAVSMATRLNRLASGVDGVTVEMGDDERLREDVSRALRFGLAGKLCIHPQQVSVVHRAMCPSEFEVDWARKVLAASAVAKGAAVKVDGRMVDLPVVLQAQRVLARAAPSLDKL
jgi:citrate lyase subunit beta / citryl-CoA lyase